MALHDLNPTPPRACRGRLRRGVTLVELLVVIGIVVLVIALVLPTLARARESSRRVSCLSNVRQLTTAALAYASANDHFLPEAASANTSLESAMCPRARFKPPWTPDNQGGVACYVLPSVGGLLEAYLAAGGASWRCPSAPESSFILQG